MDDDFAQQLVSYATRYCQTHQRTSNTPVMADLFDLGYCPPLDSAQPDEGELDGGEPEPIDWVAVERLLKKDPSAFFFHWGDEALSPFTPERYPVLDQVFRVSRFPEIAGEIYIQCYEALAQPFPTHYLGVFRLYPGLLVRAMWTIVFYVTLKEGLRLHYREQQRQRRAAKRIAFSLDEPHVAEVIWDDTDPVSPDPDKQTEYLPERQQHIAALLEEHLAAEDMPGDEDAEGVDLDGLFASPSPRERQVAALLANGVPQTSIAEQLDLTPGRISQIISQLRAKCKVPPAD